jgi:pseudouridylate synthase / pseudouridine kinase
VPPLPLNHTGAVDIMVFGSLASDLICDYSPLVESKHSISPAPYTSNPAVIAQSAGGVGYNVALAAKYAGASVRLCSVVADDLTGTSLLEHLAQTGLSSEGVQQLKQADGFRTAQYVAVNDKKKDLVMAMADMAILQDPSLDRWESWRALISSRKPKWIVVDANWSPLLLSHIISIANKDQIKVAFEPVSVPKSTRIFQPDPQIVTPDAVVPRHRISLATPNIFELETMYQRMREMSFFDSPEWWEAINNLEMSSAGSRDRLVSITNVELVDKGIPQQMIQLLPYIPNLVVKLGPQGCLLTYLLPQGDPALSAPESAPYLLGRSTSARSVVGGVYMRLFSPTEVVRQEEIVSVNGVGDTMLGVLMAGLVQDGARLEDLISVAQQGAVHTLKSAAAVSPAVQDLRSLIGHAQNMQLRS